MGKKAINQISKESNINKEPVSVLAVKSKEEPTKLTKEKTTGFKESITAKNKIFLEFFQKISMKGAGSTTENNTVKDLLYDSASIVVQEIEKTVKKGNVNEKVSFVSAECKSVESNSICLVDMHQEFEGIVSKKFSFFIDSISNLMENLSSFNKDHDITLYHEEFRIILQDMNTGIRAWISNETKEYESLKSKIEKSNFDATFGYKLVEKDNLKYLVSDEQKMNSGFIVNASLFKQVFSHCSVLKFYLIPIEMGKNEQGKFLKLSVETDNGGFEKIFREKSEITFFGDLESALAIYGIGLDSICNIAGNANLACTYASDKFMFIYTELDNNCVVRMVIAPRVKESLNNDDEPEEESIDKSIIEGSSEENTDEIESALEEAEFNDEESENKNEDKDLNKVIN